MDTLLPLLVALLVPTSIATAQTRYWREIFSPARILRITTAGGACTRRLVLA